MEDKEILDELIDKSLSLSKENSSKTNLSDRNKDDDSYDSDNVNYFKLIFDFILQEDKFRCKLLNLSLVKDAIPFEQAFPKRFATERFEYIGSGSYAQVYRHELAPKYRHHIIDLNNPQTKIQHTPSNTIIKLINVFSEDHLKNLIGVSSISSVSSYKDVYNEFRISKTLSYLNEGVRFQNYGYQCPLFPKVYGCYIINTSMPPSYFEKSIKSKHFNYRKLLENDEKEETEIKSDYLIRPFLQDIKMIQPEIAALKMEDCGQSLHDRMHKFRPLEILSVTKQLLLGFVIAEDSFQFEHRDLHLGNILVKKTNEDQLLFVYKDQFLQMPSYQLLVKVIDTTFSRLKIKNRIHHRDLSHLFDERDLHNEAGSDNRLNHQSETYQAMASEIQHDWSGFHPRTNLIWLIYVIKKFGRILKKHKHSHEFNQVQSVLKNYVSSLFKAKDMKTFHQMTLMKSQMNLLVPIQQLAIANVATSGSSSSPQNKITKRY